jgi:hypothetical protein
MGGSIDHDLEILLKKYPESHGRLILQDLSPTVDPTESLSDGIKAIPLWFFHRTDCQR